MKTLSTILFLMILASTPAAGEEKKNFEDSAFVVETDDESAAESLDRISGHVDLGFSLPKYNFRSSDHYRPGPFARQKEDKEGQFPN